MARGSQQAAAALRAAGLRSGGTSGTGTQPVPPSGASTASLLGQAASPPCQSRPTCFVVCSHPVDIHIGVVAVAAVTAGAVGWGCLQGGFGEGVGSSACCFPLLHFACRLGGNRLWCLGCCWRLAEAHIACEEGLKRHRQSEESQQGSLPHTRHADLSVLLLPPYSEFRAHLWPPTE